MLAMFNYGLLLVSLKRHRLMLSYLRRRFSNCLFIEFLIETGCFNSQHQNYISLYYMVLSSSQMPVQIKLYLGPETNDTAEYFCTLIRNYKINKDGRAYNIYTFF